MLSAYNSESLNFEKQCSVLPLPFNKLKRSSCLIMLDNKLEFQFFDVKKVNKKPPGKNYFTFIFVFLANVGLLELYNFH